MSVTSSVSKTFTQALLLGLSVLFALPSLAFAANHDVNSPAQAELAQTQSGIPDIVVFGTDSLPITPMSIAPNLQPSLANGTDFGTGNSDHGVVRVFEVKNQGTGTLTFPVEHYVTQDPSFRTVNTLPSSLGPGESFFLEVAFSPTIRYETLTWLQFRSNDPDTPTYQFRIKGYGQIPIPWLVEVNAIFYDGNISCVPSSYSPYCTFQPTSLGATRVHTFTLKNIGNHNLILNELEPIKTAWENNPNQFTIIHQPDPIIPPGSQTTFTIQFNPSNSGDQAITFHIHTNAPSSKKLMYLSLYGTGRGAYIRVDGAGTGENPADFGTAYIGFTTGSRTFVFSNSNTDYYDVSGITIGGRDASDFRIASPMIERVHVGQYQNFTVAFEPTTPGLKEATITITSTALNIPVYTFPIKGLAHTRSYILRGGDQEIVDGSLPSLNTLTDFGNVPLHTTVTRAFYIENTGDSPISFPTIKLSGSDFSPSDYFMSRVAHPGQKLAFYIHFTPRSVGFHTADVLIRTGGTVVTEHRFMVQASVYKPSTPPPNRSEDTLIVRGNGNTILYEDELIWPANNTDFGTLGLGASKDHNFHISSGNSGTIDLDPGQAFDLSGPQASSFSLVQTPSGSISSDTLIVRFSPTSSGLHEAFVIIRSSDQFYPEFRFKIRGYGANSAAPEDQGAQALSVIGGGTAIDNGEKQTSSDAKTQFGSVALNQSLSHTFIISNYGTKPLNLTGTKIRISGAHASDFNISQEPSSSIAPSAASSFQIRFAPKASGLRSATIIIESDDPNTPSFSFVVQGTGTSEQPEQPTNQYTIALPIVRK